MKLKYYLDNQQFLAGVTLKDPSELEAGNLALHQCSHPVNILYNREQFADVLEQPLKNFIFSEQTHSTNWHHVTFSDKGKGVFTLDDAIPDTDAFYTYEPQIVLTAMTADCVPVLFYHTKTGVIGTIHSGWKGTVGEIARKVFAHLIENEKCSPEDFYVLLGPSISQEKFEVGLEVYEQFQALGYAEPSMTFNETTKKYHINNQQVVKTQCELAGIPNRNIRLDPMCTFQSADGFSYREDKQTGRHVSFIMKKSVL